MFQQHQNYTFLCITAVADPGFPIGGHQPHRGGCQLLRRLCFIKFVCRNERIWTLRGGKCQQRPLDLPMHWTCSQKKKFKTQFLCEHFMV